MCLTLCLTLLGAVFPLGALEADCGACRFGSGHPDLGPDLDTRLKNHLAAGRTVAEIAELEAGGSLIRPPIELWANQHPAAAHPDRLRLKYRGSILDSRGIFSAMEPSVRIGGVCVGTDKLGHMFQTGWDYYIIAVIDRSGEEVAVRYGEWLEGVEPSAHYAAHENYFRRQRAGSWPGYGGFGRGVSGIVSHADLAANLAGLALYRDLAARRFQSITNYVSASLCEEANRNDYSPAMRALVQRNGRW